MSRVLGVQRMREIIEYRPMLTSLVRSELRARYKGSVLGFLWTFVNPLLQLAVYSLVFKVILRSNIRDYPVFLFIGLLAWNMFTGALQSSCGVIVNKASLVKKIYFPREILPASMAGTALVNYVLSLAILIPILLITGFWPTWSWLFAPVAIVAIFFMALGLSLIFSAINVYMRDTEHILNIVLMLWFYGTPVVYSINSVPHFLSALFKVDPIAAAILVLQEIFYYREIPHWKMLIYCVVSGVCILWIGWAIFYKLSRRFAEEV